MMSAPRTPAPLNKIAEESSFKLPEIAPTPSQRAQVEARNQVEETRSRVARIKARFEGDYATEPKQSIS